MHCNDLECVSWQATSFNLLLLFEMTAFTHSTMPIFCETRWFSYTAPHNLCCMLPPHAVRPTSDCTFFCSYSDRNWWRLSRDWRAGPWDFRSLLKYSILFQRFPHCEYAVCWFPSKTDIQPFKRRLLSDSSTLATLGYMQQVVDMIINVFNVKLSMGSRHRRVPNSDCVCINGCAFWFSSKPAHILFVFIVTGRTRFCWGDGYKPRVLFSLQISQWFLVLLTGQRRYA